MELDSIPFTEVARGILVLELVLLELLVLLLALSIFGRKTEKAPKGRAVREALEERPAAGAHAPDPEVREIGEGSLLVQLQCHTAQSFLQFISDYESHAWRKKLHKAGSKEESESPFKTKRK